MSSSEERTDNSITLNDDDIKNKKSESLGYVKQQSDDLINTRRNSNDIIRDIRTLDDEHVEVKNTDTVMDIYTGVEDRVDRGSNANADSNTHHPSDPTTGDKTDIESGVDSRFNHASLTDTNNINTESHEGNDPGNGLANKDNSRNETEETYIKTIRNNDPGGLPDQKTDAIPPKEKDDVSESEESSESLESEINICISDTKLEDLKQKKSLRERIQKWLGYHQVMSQREFGSQIQILYKCCLKSVRDLHELHLRRTAGLEILDDLILRAKPTYLTIAHVIHITWSIMSCLHHFQLRLRTVSIGLVAWTRRRTAEHCMTSYSKLIRIFRPEMHRIILNAIITFYREGKLWQIEFACRELIVELLEVYKYAEEGIEDMLYTIETSTLVNVHEAKYIVQVLYDVLKKINWKRMSEYLMKKFLSMLESSILPKPTDKYNYCPLRKGLEICLINIIGNLNVRDLMKLLYLILKKIKAEHVDEEMLLCFGNVAAYAAKKYRIKTLRTTVFKGPLPLIFSLFKFKNSLLMLLATRIWQNLIDRNNNSKTFLTPKIFFQDCNYALNMKKCKDEDKAFFKSVRHLVYQISLNDFLNAQERMGIENSYQAVALTLVEIPCGYTASCFITVAMSLQEYAFSITKDDLVRSHHLHATILALLTLICYIHNASFVYQSPKVFPIVITTFQQFALIAIIPMITLLDIGIQRGAIGKNNMGSDKRELAIYRALETQSVNKNFI